ncbi:MAG: nucleotidyltransferase family protein [Lentisphaerales bacterium]|nr:nucleotidyltransferase family protein [Lentisphaerales bacterium]
MFFLLVYLSIIMLSCLIFHHSPLSSSSCESALYPFYPVKLLPIFPLPIFLSVDLFPSGYSCLSFPFLSSWYLPFCVLFYIDMNVINLLKEFTEILSLFEEGDISYAVIGGLAVNIYTQVRATKDLDFLIHEGDLVKAVSVAESLGYTRKENTIPFPSSGLELLRLLKKVDDDFVVLDFLIAKSEEMKTYLRNSQRVEMSFGFVRVIEKRDLIAMKKLAGRPQDLVDIKNLEGEGNA